MTWYRLAIVGLGEMTDQNTDFARFRANPAAYLREVTLPHVDAFMRGYAYACSSSDGEAIDNPFVLPREFHDWVAYRLHYYESTRGYLRMIEEQSDGDTPAVDLFFELLDQFRGRRAHTVARLSNIDLCYERDGRSLRYPNAVRLVVYTRDPGFFVVPDAAGDLPRRRYFATLEGFELHFNASGDMLEILDPEWKPGR